MAKTDQESHNGHLCVLAGTIDLTPLFHLRMTYKMKLSDIRIIFIASLSLFLGGISLQLSLFHKISQHRNATVLDVPAAGPRQSAVTIPRAQQNLGRCAINLFGLPRAFESLVLPSLLKNVIQRECVDCDVASVSSPNGFGNPLILILVASKSHSKRWLPMRLLCPLLQLDP